MPLNSQAFLFDLNGTMIDDMAFHVDVWHDLVVNQFGSSFTKDQVKAQMYGKNEEVLVRIFGDKKFSPSELATISINKEKEYQRIYKPHLRLLPGLDNFLQQAFVAKIKMAIGSAAIPFNIDFVLDNLNIRHYFGAIVSASDVSKSKPHPETYLKAAEILGLSPASCIVFEDAPKGVESAERAGMKAVVITTMHEESEFSQYKNVIKFVEDYRELDSGDLVGM
jgi:beta-phosphoglucomutase